MIQSSLNAESSANALLYGHPVIRLDESEIWTAGHAQEIKRQIEQRFNPRAPEPIIIDMSRVKTVSGGVFGMLCELHDEGKEIYLHEVHDNVRRLIWFDRFFEHLFANLYGFREQPRLILSEEDVDDDGASDSAVDSVSA